MPGRVPGHTSRGQMGTFRQLKHILPMQHGGCTTQSLWPPLVISVARGQRAQRASAPGLAPKGTAWIWQICEVCL